MNSRINRTKTPLFFDAHAHVNFPAYDADRDAVTDRALQASVWMANVGTTLETSRRAVELAERFESGVYAIVGIHPTHADPSHADPDETGDLAQAGTEMLAENFNESAFRALTEHKKTVAIGECGLDYFRLGDESFEKQATLFRKHIELALSVNKPLMLHIRPHKGSDDAYTDALAILADYPQAKADFHFFAGSFEVASRILDCGFLLSFTGVTTFAHSYDDIIKNIPLDRMMIETDCPYVAPVPYRGKRNEPSYVIEVAKAVSRIRGDDGETVQRALVANTMQFFNLAV
jgi:TatD DNase family protein